MGSGSQAPGPAHHLDRPPGPGGDDVPDAVDAHGHAEVLHPGNDEVTPGHLNRAYQELEEQVTELLARVSLSGGPAAASGDWYGSMIVRPAESRSVSLTIDQQVP